MDQSENGATGNGTTGRSKKESKGFWLRRRVLVIPLVAVGVSALIPGIAGAWFSWDGVDPTIDLDNGHKMSITVNVQRRLGCFIDKPIKIDVRLPKAYKDAKVVSESSSHLDCYEYPDNTVTTRTRLNNGGHDNTAEIKVALHRENDQSYPWSVDVCIDDKLVASLQGSSDEAIKGEIPLAAPGASAPPCPTPRVLPPI